MSVLMQSEPAESRASAAPQTLGGGTGGTRAHPVLTHGSGYLCQPRPVGRSPPWPSGAPLGNHRPPGLLGPSHRPSASPSPTVPPSLARHVAQRVMRAPVSLTSLSPQGLELFKRRTRVTVSPPETWVPNLEAGDRVQCSHSTPRRQGCFPEGAGTGAPAGKRAAVVSPGVTRT